MEIKINGLVKCTKMPDRNGWKQLFGTKWEEATAHLKHSILITEEMVYVYFDMLPFLSPSSSNAYDCIHIGLWQCGVRYVPAPYSTRIQIHFQLVLVSNRAAFWFGFFFIHHEHLAWCVPIRYFPSRYDAWLTHTCYAMVIRSPFSGVC